MAESVLLLRCVCSKTIDLVTEAHALIAVRERTDYGRAFITVVVGNTIL
jgi:hypothetical protein